MVFKTHPFISHTVFLVSGRNHLTCAFLTSGHILGLSARLSPSLTSSHSHIYISLGSYTPGSAFPSHISSFSHVTTTRTIRLAQFQISQSVKAIDPAQPHYHTYPHNFSFSSIKPHTHFQFIFNIHTSLFTTLNQSI